MYFGSQFQKVSAHCGEEGWLAGAAQSVAMSLWVTVLMLLIRKQRQYAAMRR